MLKIIDGVNLKILEKFGFEYNGVSYEKNIYCMKNSKADISKFHANVKVIPNRLLLIDIYNDSEILSTDGFDLDIIYDLIQMGLVEQIK